MEAGYDELMSEKTKKKAGAKKPDSPRGKELPLESERGDSWLIAQYGEDSRNPVMWSLINAKFHLKTCSALEPDKPLADAMFDRAEQMGRDSGHWSIRIGFYEAASKAILAGDAEFFREVARLLETRIEGPPERRVDLALNHAFARLHALEGKLPTKKQVRDAALREMALSNVLGRMPGPSAWMDAHYFPGGTDRASLKPEVRKEVDQEIERIPEQNWTALFKRCGLSNLPNDKGGQPSHSKRRYCR